MIRRVFHIILCLATLSVTACVEPLAPGVKERMLEVKLICDEPLPTKAGHDGTEQGVDRYNENLISWVDFFFYQGENPSLDVPAALHLYAPAGSRYEHVFHLEALPNIFDGSGNTTVFALVNYPGSASTSYFDGQFPTLDALYALSVTSDFVTPANHKQARFMMSATGTLTKPSDGICTGTLNLQRYAAKMTVAVKVEDEVVIGKGDDAVTWRPMLEGMEIYLVDGVKTVKLGGDEYVPGDGDYFSYSKNRKKFVRKNADESLEVLVPPMSGDYYNTYPMYMYPQHWVYGSTEAPDKEPYLKLVLPWYSEGNSSTQRQFYYKILLPEDSRDEYKMCFARNNWYHIAIDVGFLGAETDNESVVVDGSCLVLQWQNKDLVMKQAEIGRARYLAVERDTLVLRNVSTAVSIPYYTSHPVVIIGSSVTCPYYGVVGNGGTAKGGKVRVNADGSKEIVYNSVEWWVNTGSSIEFEHQLNNEITSADVDYSPYHIELTLAHQDRQTDPNYQRKLIIEQIPAVYIDKITNSDSNQVGGSTTFVEKDNGTKKPVSTYWGYTFVDGGCHWPENESTLKTISNDDFYCVWQAGHRQWRRGEKADSGDPFFKLATVDQRIEYQWRAIWYTGGSLDIFRVNVSVLPEDSEYVIGDPRVDVINNLDYAYPGGYLTDETDDGVKKEKKLPAREGFAVADALDGSTRSLKYYYPTDESDKTNHMLAPGYRVSSKFNGTEYSGLNNLPAGMDKNHARWRCAAYQEDGFPAGRWRLPTRAEIQFIAQLSANGAFATLFNNNTNYWSAQGVVRVEDGEVKDYKTDYALLRCVYDSWYWGEDQTEFDTWSKSKYGDNSETNRVRNHFVWGDKER